MTRIACHLLRPLPWLAAHLLFTRLTFAAAPALSLPLGYLTRLGADCCLLCGVQPRGLLQGASGVSRALLCHGWPGAALLFAMVQLQLSLLTNAVLAAVEMATGMAVVA